MKYENKNNREYFRIKLDVPLCSKISIAMIDNKVVNTGEAYACIRDIGPGGLRFYSHLDFPVEKNMVMNFNITLLQRSVNFQGRIVRKNTTYTGKLEYGVRFYVNDIMRIKYMKLFNQLAIHIIKRKSPLMYSFCTKKDKTVCVKTNAS